MWHKGYTHYHTSFHYPAGQRITPKELAEDLKKLGASFVFCAGDHGIKGGDYYWGWDEEFKEYKEICFSNSKDGDFILTPSLEVHLRFPPFNERHEHHTCIPALDYLPKVKPAKTPDEALSYTREIDRFIFEAHKHNISLTINHPYISVNSFFQGPSPLTVPSLYQFDYLELFTIGHLDYFPYDFDLYVKFLSHPISSIMACCASVDNAVTPCRLLSTEKRAIPSTFLHVSGKLDRESLRQAWNERSTYAVFGNLYLEEINPIPSRRFIEGVERPSLSLTVRNTGRKKVDKLEIYRNGRKIYEDKNSRKDKYSLNWEDKNPLKGENHYLTHIEAEREHLITSPITYFVK